jgi:hypothetical protein
MPRTPVDVVVPFAGSDQELRALHARLAELRLDGQDTLTIVDNRANGGDVALDGVLSVPERQSSYHARNRGAARGSAPWIVFVDADLEVSPDLVDRYFDEPPAPETALLIGEIEITLTEQTPVARYGWRRQHLDTGRAAKPGWEYAQTANAAVRRDAFEAIGGFEGHVRSGGDADLAFRLRRAGHGHEHRPAAVVRHPPRSTLPALVRQFARYGSGRQWLHERYPAFAPPRSLPRLAGGTVKATPRALLVAARGDRDGALAAVLDPLIFLVSELGRLVPNERGPGRGATVRHALRVLRERRRGS